MTQKNSKRRTYKPKGLRVNLSLSADLHTPLAQEAQRKAVPEATLVRMILAERYVSKSALLTE